MSKLSLIPLFSQLSQSPIRSQLGPSIGAFLLAFFAFSASPARGQDDADRAEPDYPKAVAVSGDALYVADRFLPGVWEIGESRSLFAMGSNLLRKPLNAPHCITPHPKGGVLVGDSATREVYWIESSGAEPKALTDGHIGVPMALVVDPAGEHVYVGDAEKFVTFRVPIAGGPPELVARVNARGLAFESDGKLLAVTPDKAAIQRIDVETGDVETVVDGMPFEFPNGLCWAGDHGYVTDTYGNCIWKFTSNGEIKKWHEGAPLERPVGIAVSDDAVFVADPKLKQIFEFDRASKESKPRM